MDYYTKQMMSLRHKIRMYLTMFSLGEKKGGGGGGEGMKTIFKHVSLKKKHGSSLHAAPYVCTLSKEHESIHYVKHDTTNSV